MNKRVWCVLSAAAILTSSAVWAQQPSAAAGNHRRSGNQMDQMARMAMNKQSLDNFMQIIVQLGLMYKMMEPAKVVAAPDGFVATFGNKIIKYDKDLNVVKEVALDIDVDAMDKIASGVAQKYSAQILAMMASGAKGKGMAPPMPGTLETAGANDDPVSDEVKKELEEM